MLIFFGLSLSPFGARVCTLRDFECFLLPRGDVLSTLGNFGGEVKFVLLLDLGRGDVSSSPEAWAASLSFFFSLLISRNDRGACSVSTVSLAEKTASEFLLGLRCSSSILLLSATSAMRSPLTKSLRAT